MSSPSSSPFTLEEFADLVSAALDPQHSPCPSSSSSPSPSSSSSFLRSPFMSFADRDASDALHGGRPAKCHLKEMSPRLTLPWIQDHYRARQHHQRDHHHNDNDNYSDPVKPSGGRCPTRNTFHDERKLDLPKTHLPVPPSFPASSANTPSTFTPSTPQGNNNKLLTPSTTPPTVLITPPPPQPNHTEPEREPQRRRSCVKFALSHQIPIPPPPPIPDYTITSSACTYPDSPSAPHSRSMPLLYAPPAPLPIGETPFPPIIAATMSSVDLGGHCLEFEGVSGCAGVVRERSKSRERSRERERSRLRARSSMPVELSTSTPQPAPRDTLRIPIRSSPIRSERGPASPSRPTPTPLAVAASPSPSTSHAKSAPHKSSKLNLKITGAHTKSSAPISPVSPTTASKSTPNPLALFARIKRQLSRNNVAAGGASELHSASCPTTPISGGFNYPPTTTTTTPASGLPSPAPSPSSQRRMPSEDDAAPGPPVELGLEYRYDNGFDYQYQFQVGPAKPSTAVPFPASPAMTMTIPSALVSSNSYLSLSGQLVDVESALGTGTGTGSGSRFRTALDSGFRSGPDSGSGVESQVDTASDVSMSTSRGGRKRRRSRGKRDRDTQTETESASAIGSGSTRENWRRVITHNHHEAGLYHHHQPTRPSRALGGSIFGVKNYYDSHERDYEYVGHGSGSFSNSHSNSHSSSPSRYSCDSAPLGFDVGGDGDEYSIIGSSCSFFLELRGREAARGLARFEEVGAEMLREGCEDVDVVGVEEEEDKGGYKPYVPLVIQHEREQQRQKQREQQEKQHGLRTAASMVSLKSVASSKHSRRSKAGASAPSSPSSSSDRASSRRSRRTHVPHPLPLPVSSARSTTTLPSPPPSPPGPPPRFSRSLSVSSTESGPPVTPCTPLFVVTDAEGRTTMGMEKRGSRVVRVSMEEESEPVVRQARQIGVSRPIAFSIPPASPTQKQQPIQAHISTPTTPTNQNPPSASPNPNPNPNTPHTTASPPPSPQTQTLMRVKTRSRQSVAIHAAVPLSPPPMGPLPLPPPLRAAAAHSSGNAAARVVSGTAHVSNSAAQADPARVNERGTSGNLGADASPRMQEGVRAAENTKSTHIYMNANGSSSQRRNSASTTTSSCVLGSITTSRSSSTSNYASAPGSRARSVSLSSSSFAAVATAGAFLPPAPTTESISDGSSILTSTQEEDECDDAAAARVLAANTLANANRNRHISLIGGKKTPVPLIGVGRQIVRRGSTKAIEEDGVGEWTLLLGASEERRVKRKESVIKMRGAGRMLSVPTALGKDTGGKSAERMRTKSESALRRSSPTADSNTNANTTSGQDWTLSLPGLRNKKSLIRAVEIAVSPAVSSPAIAAPASTRASSDEEDALCVPRVVSLGSGIDSSAVSASLANDEEDDDALSSLAPRESNSNLENLHKLEKDLEKFNAMLLRAPSLSMGLGGRLRHAKSCGVLPGVDEPPPKNAVLRSVEVFTDAGAMASALSVPSQQSVKRTKSTATLRIDTSSEGATATAAVRRAPSTSSTKSSSSSSAELTPTALNPPSFNILSSLQSQSQTLTPAQPHSQTQTRPPSLKARESAASPSPSLLPRAVQRDSTLSVGSSNDVYFSDSSVSGEYYSARSSLTSALSPEV